MINERFAVILRKLWCWHKGIFYIKTSLYLYNAQLLSMNKRTVQKTIDELPEEFTLDELLEKLIFINKIERGLNDAQAGRLTSHEEVKKRFVK